MNDPILDEIHAVRRHHWLEAGGTWDGLCACYDRLSAEMAEKGPEAVFRDWLAARKRERMEREEAMGAVCVGEEREVYGVAGGAATGRTPKECTMQNAECRMQDWGREEDGDAGGPPAVRQDLQNERMDCTHERVETNEVKS